jgi:hypothetical protein
MYIELTFTNLTVTPLAVETPGWQTMAMLVTVNVLLVIKLSVLTEQMQSRGATA